MQLSSTQKLMLSALKSIIGNMTFRLDRQRQIVIIKQNAETKELTYEQLAEILEQLFPGET